MSKYLAYTVFVVLIVATLVNTVGAIAYILAANWWMTAIFGFLTVVTGVTHNLFALWLSGVKKRVATAA